MSREEQRVVEFVVTEKGKAKKGKKPSKKEVKKIGLFHVWSANGKGSKKFIGLVEDVETGLLIEVSYKAIRFLTESDLEEVTAEVIAETESLLAVAEEAETEAEAVTESVEEATTAEAVTESKPKRTKKS